MCQSINSVSQSISNVSVSLCWGRGTGWGLGWQLLKQIDNCGCSVLCQGVVLVLWLKPGKPGLVLVLKPGLEAKVWFWGPGKIK